MMPPAARAPKPGKAKDDAAAKAAAEKLVADARAEAEQVKADAQQAAEQVRTDAESAAAEIRSTADQVLADAQDQAAGVLAGARDAVGAAPAEAGETDEYRVVIPGASYSLPSVATSRRFALKGAIVELDAAEAARLRELGAVVGKDEPDPVPLGAPEGDNPVGGKELESKEAHAAKVAAAKAGEGK